MSKEAFSPRVLRVGYKVAGKIGRLFTPPGADSDVVGAIRLADFEKIPGEC